MKVSVLLGERLKHVSDESQIESQVLMTKGGYMKPVASGIYSLLPPAQRISRKIQRIIREEMDRIDGQEVLFPVVMPASLWQSSGRYTSIGSEMVRFEDRGGNKMVLGMTHEEAAVHMADHIAKSYTQYPFMIYQLQTKFRDEPRARGGLIRVREFTMKDAYSFHTSQEDLEKYYERAYEAYVRIFKRVGAKNVIAVKSDSGMMGGSVSHEFMLLTDVGEDTLVICPDCGYSANMEVAECITKNAETSPAPLTKVATPNAKTIEEVCAFLGKKPEDTAKAVVYAYNDTDEYIVVFVRGDTEVNETKLRNYLKREVHPAAAIREDSGIVPGFIGGVGLTDKVDVVVDRSLEGLHDLVTGANEEGYHYTGFDFARDYGRKFVYVDVAKARAGGICPVCGKPHLTVSKGIEVGNIFQLGDKYTKSMGMTYLDKDNTEKHPIMGCYGIGVGRLMASVCQESRDEYGPVWPMSIAPWQVEVCDLRVTDDKVRARSEQLVSDLERMGVEVLYDDREVRPGSMFADADLFGVPVRVVVSQKTEERGVVEVSTRDKKIKMEFAADEAAEKTAALVKELLAAYEI
ncbi:MAG TPA: proline--tRNA ligase [Candidatus Protoclostridium stercorigallinarum]|uniref:Proline--tRNA ligase n=1 Tax=Candidatus Protoclostridium stercorigallinarum TaxID=2838741 RepID=A0A9D1PZH1_9FIRM|nr:proline--tRNA ligase [Candidatus Protoclostridium stercorigallinarum]